mmetsp:Transcript_7527/g.11333  ORF Transcript_7527/g.11333 Transcript_7527/m.11333 type:complete len:133 (-) Transcript_7527:36-434(-)
MEKAEAAQEQLARLESFQLFALSKLSGVICHPQNLAWTNCRKSQRDQSPLPCLELGEAATVCAMDTYAQVQTKCPTEFNAFSDCMMKGQFANCRKEEKIFHDECIMKHFVNDMKSSNGDKWEARLSRRFPTN